jgi:riboflavin kinase
LSKKTTTEILILLAKGGAHLHDLKLSLSWLAGQLDVSRQTAARRLLELEGQGLIKRALGPRGQNVHITPPGLAALRLMHRELETIFGLKSRSFKLAGRVISGVGEGSYYMGKRGYREQFERELGFDPYPGTLDIKLDKASLELKAMLTQLPGKQVEGFRTSERTFGPVKFFPAKLKDKEAALILPLRSHYADVVELIAPKKLRESLKLKDGDVVQVEVMV